MLRDLKRYDEAIESYGRAIDIRPDYAEALNNRGYSHWAHAHNYAAALADLERALAIDPDHPYARGEILHIKMYGADWSDFEKRKTDIEGAIHSGQRVMRPFGFQALSSSPEDLQACARIYARDLYAENPGTPHDAAARKAARKIRIGYVSADFRQQATAILMAGTCTRPMTRADSRSWRWTMARAMAARCGHGWKRRSTGGPTSRPCRTSRQRS